MKFRTFALFVGPSVFLMLAFIAVPLAFVLMQSFQRTEPVLERVEMERCTPGFVAQTCTTEVVSRPKLDDEGILPLILRALLASLLGGEGSQRNGAATTDESCHEHSQTAVPLGPVDRDDGSLRR